MSERTKPLFLARQSYRRRRLIDASRHVPLFGAVIMLIPLLWTEPGSGSLAVRGLFLFAAWGVLVVVSAGLARLLAVTSDGSGGGAAAPDQAEAPGDGDVL